MKKEFMEEFIKLHLKAEQKGIVEDMKSALTKEREDNDKH